MGKETGCGPAEYKIKEVQNMSLSRLSPYNINDTLHRAELYREIRNGAENQTEGWTEYEIQPDERLMPELIAHRFYGTDKLKWAVMVVAQLDDLREALPVGETIWLPPIVWVRQRIKYHSGLEE
jgi:hypothetical protein